MQAKAMNVFLASEPCNSYHRRGSAIPGRPALLRRIFEEDSGNGLWVGHSMGRDGRERLDLKDREC